MQVIESYRDLCSEIELLGWLLDDVKRQQMRNKADMHGHTIPFLKTLNVFDNLNEREQALIDELEEKNNLKRLIENRVGQFSGIEYVVAFNRDILGKSLQQIADESKYSYNHIRRISGKTKSKKQQRCNNNAVK